MNAAHHLPTRKRGPEGGDGVGDAKSPPGCRQESVALTEPEREGWSPALASGFLNAEACTPQDDRSDPEIATLVPRSTGPKNEQRRGPCKSYLTPFARRLC